MSQIILETDFFNPVLDANTTREVCSGKEWLANDPPAWQWTPLLDQQSEFETQLVGISGVVVNDGVSDDDVPFTHPFGNDYEFYIAPDLMYRDLLAPSNKVNLLSSRTNSRLSAAASAAAVLLDDPTLPGVLGVEADEFLVPDEFRAKHGDRVVVFGRLIADCGHDDFHTEIHPHLLLVAARPSSDASETQTTVVGRPYLVSQVFGKGTLRAHLIEEVSKVMTFQSLKLEAHPTIHTVPFSGLHAMTYLIRPPITRPSLDHQLFVSFHFTVRSGVTVRVEDDIDHDAVRVHVVMNAAAYIPAELPPKHKINLLGADILKMSEDAGAAYAAIVSIAPANPLNPIAAPILATGILTDKYDPPSAVSAFDNEVVNIAVSDLSDVVHFSVDDAQPFPIYGRLQLRWRLASPGPTTAKTMLIPARDGFVRTGKTVTQGSPLSITASGEWSNGGDAPTFVGPSGFEGLLLPGSLLVSANLACLVGRIGDVIFVVGENFSAPSPSSGELLLGMNDIPGATDDNLGELRVTIFAS